MSSEIDKQLAAVDKDTLERLKALVRGGVAQCGTEDIAPFDGLIEDATVCASCFCDGCWCSWSKCKPNLTCCA